MDRVLQTVSRTECCRHCCGQCCRHCCGQSVEDSVAGRVLRIECCSVADSIVDSVADGVLQRVLRIECCRQRCGHSVADTVLRTVLQIVLRTESCRQCCIQKKGRKLDGVSFSVPSARSPLAHQSKAVTHFRAPV